MKITVLSGSAHKKGTSALLVDQFIKGATEAGHEVFRFDAAFKDIHSCIGCDTCNTKKQGCIYKDDMQEVNPHLLEADAIVLVSPIYYYNINAQLKAVIDRFYANNAALQGNRKAAMLLTMADEGMESAEGPIAFFKNFCEYMQWENRGTIAATACWKREDIESTAYPQQAYELGKNF